MNYSSLTERNILSRIFCYGDEENVIAHSAIITGAEYLASYSYE